MMQIETDCAMAEAMVRAIQLPYKHTQPSSPWHAPTLGWPKETRAKSAKLRSIEKGVAVQVLAHCGHTRAPQSGKAFGGSIRNRQ